MGQYTKTDLTNNSSFSTTWINGELGKIATALNKLENTNFDSGVVPNTALASRYFRFELDLEVEAIGAGAVITTSQAMLRIPEDCTLLSCYFTAMAIAGAADPTADVYKVDASPATILTGVVTIADAATAYAGTLAETAFTAGDILSLRATTDGAGSCTKLKAQLWFKATHTT